jgi:hypothetical protein
MRLRIFAAAVLIAFASLLPGCKSPEKKEQEKAKKEKAAKPEIPDMSTDTNFQAFLGRLRTAVGKRDRQMLSSLLAPDFGWRWENPAPGNPFDYWDQSNTWGELEKLLHERFTPSGVYMVSPPAFASDPKYRGYRMGIRLVNGGWKFAYFITGEDLLQ